MTPPPVCSPKAKKNRGWLFEPQTGGGVITVEEAKQIVFENTPLGPKAVLPLTETQGCVLAQDLFAPGDSPAFDSSAMDGFALRHEEAPGRFRKAGTVTAGCGENKGLYPGECLEIMTGAKIPAGATAVVPYEEAAVEGEWIEVSKPVPIGAHIRKRAEQLRKGDAALPKGTPVTPGAVGLLASLGFLETAVHRPPKIFIIPTGSELVSDFGDGGGDKIMESNSPALRAALRELPVTVEASNGVPDHPKILSAVLEVALARHDMVLITGGVSVGAHDHVKSVLQKGGVKPLFWGVAQKPGKPLYFGKKKDVLVFGLPGNPASALVCYYEYVRLALLRWLGHPQPDLRQARAYLTKTWEKKEGRTHFVRAIAQKKKEKWWVHPLEGQDSHFMKSFALANCLMVAPQEASRIQEGEEVTIHWLP